jgi:hypothetical protein
MSAHVTMELTRQINLSVSVGKAKSHAATWNAPRTAESKVNANSGTHNALFLPGGPEGRCVFLIVPRLPRLSLSLSTINAIWPGMSPSKERRTVAVLTACGFRRSMKYDKSEQIAVPRMLISSWVVGRPFVSLVTLLTTNQLERASGFWSLYIVVCPIWYGAVRVKRAEAVGECNVR